MSFVHLHTGSATPAATDSCLIIQGDRLLVLPEISTAVTLPSLSLLQDWSGLVSTRLPLGQIGGQSLWFCAVDDATLSPPSGLEWQETRALLSVFSPAQWQAVSCARELLWWDRRHRFCGACGTPTVAADNERARRCPHCSAMFFPVVSSAVIVAVTRGDQLLLAHNRNFRPGMFSLLAGFVDPGETLEQAAVREVREEVGIDIDHLQFVTSQPWPFPNSLMMGFRAQYVGGDIVVDGKEIEQANWYRRDALPEIPRPGTVARLLIDRWLGDR